MSVSARVKQLEKATGGGGRIVVARLVHPDFSPMTQREEAETLAAAHAEAGPGGEVLTVRYVQDWRGEEQ